MQKALPQTLIGEQTQQRNLRKLIVNNLYWLPLIVMTLWTVLPLIWSFSASLKGPIEIYENPYIIPAQPTLENYADVFTYTNFWRYFFNSAFLAITSTTLALVISLLAAYAFARYAFWARNLLLLAILVPRILPRASLIVPLYRIMESVGLLDTYTALIVTYTATAIPFSAWILTGFINAVPRELEEAAATDGANLWQRLRHVVVPVSVPGLLTVSVFAMREAWNEFPFVLSLTTSSEIRTLPYQLYLLRDSTGIQDWPLMNAFTIVTILPILLLYVRFEKNIISGLTRGALK
jgi:ABC-type glycerol-3-phosphate transport system permease component